MRAVIAATFCATMLVGCTGSDTGSTQPLSVQIRLYETSVAAGQPIHGVAVVTNRNDEPLVIATCNHIWLQVGLTGAGLPYHAVWDLCADKGGTAVQPGTSRMPVTIQTTYPACTPHARSASARLPMCLRPHRDPTAAPLPPGHYFTKTVAIPPEGTSVITSHPVMVTISS
jgi:hypothetical protein